MKKKWTWLWLVLIVIVIIGISGAGIMKYLNSNLSKLAASTIPEVDLASVKDGVYTGSYTAFPVRAEVKVTVENHKIMGIVLTKHVSGQGKGAEIIPAKVVETQSLQLDVVSGATYSSKVILKAISAALKKGID